MSMCVLSWVRHEARRVKHASCATVPIKASNTEGGGACKVFEAILKKEQRS